MVRLTLQPVFTHLYDVSFTSPSEDLRCMWSVITKAKGSICQGDRLENLSWRLWHASTKGFSRLIDADGNLLPNTALSTCSAEHEYDEPQKVLAHPGRAAAHASSMQAANSPPASSTAPNSRSPSPKAPCLSNDVRILHSLSNVLEEIRDSIPTANSHGHHHRKSRNGSNGSTRSGAFKGHSFGHTHGLYAHFNGKPPAPTKTHSSVSPPRSHLFLSALAGSAVAPKKGQGSAGQLPHPAHPLFQTLHLPANSPQPPSQLHSQPQRPGSRPPKAVHSRPALLQRYSGHYSQNIAGLDSDAYYQVDPNDPEHALPATTFPYDETQFELASRALGLAPPIAESESSSKTNAAPLARKSPSFSAMAAAGPARPTPQHPAQPAYELGGPVPLEAAPRTSLLSILLGGAGSNGTASQAGSVLSPPLEASCSPSSLPTAAGTKSQADSELSAAGKTSVASQTDSTASPCHVPLTSVAQAQPSPKSLSHHSSASPEQLSSEPKVYHHLSDVDSSSYLIW